MNLLPEIEQRRSVRKYTGEGIPADSMERILDAGRRAPSAKNRQAWRFIVIEESSAKMKIQDAAFGQEYITQAGAVIALCTTNVDYRMPNGQLSYTIDLSFATSFMMMQAVHEGFGTCVVTTFDEAEVKHILTVPYSMRVVMLLAIGHSDEVPPESERHSLSRIVSYNHW